MTPTEQKLRARLAALEVELRYIVGEITLLNRSFKEFASKGIDVNSLQRRAEAALLECSDADLTPTPEGMQETVAEAFRMTDERAQSGKTSAGGFRVGPKKGDK